MKAPRHGTVSGYRHDKCRCDACRDANTKAVRDWRKREAFIPWDGQPVHLCEDVVSGWGEAIRAQNDHLANHAEPVAGCFFCEHPPSALIDGSPRG